MTAFCIPFTEEKTSKSSCSAHNQNTLKSGGVLVDDGVLLSI